ncbi:5-oxoprolinase subunit B family protein [Rubrimonas cliftonensis]|uniref:Sensor histidine kinase inhibitor, KipI family n=1 Tax=Rubrimonas cliftonensis TaxID=89524 RepID=A0A1H4D7T7_9RHOB|nr:carboxyltransferase domain-containing protein [Rubrimonas cliftonensis]SEA68322.1 sensor histidine kinase inhibitor, KipI family [Rubrimonas cliftonensis]
MSAATGGGEVAARVAPLGDAAFTLVLGEAPGPATTARLAAVAAALGEAPGVVDLAPSFAALTVHLDPDAADRPALEARALALADPALAPKARPGAAFDAPLCVEPDHGPDQREVAAETGLTVDAVLDLLLGARLDVLAVGFLPGFPFCGPAPAALHLPRKPTPRLRVPKGSVAVANGFVGIYPWVSPGGWRILGASCLPLFDPARARPSMFAAGDRLRLHAVSAAEHERLRAAAEAGEIGPEDFRITGEGAP